jgi:hypothetical protein
MAFALSDLKGEDDSIDLAYGMPEGQPRPGQSAAGAPDAAGPRARALHLLKELNKAIQKGGKSLLGALRTLVPELEALRVELENLDGANPVVRDLQVLIEAMRRLLGEAKPTVANAKVLGRRAIAILATMAGVDPRSAGTERESFWK